MNTKKIVISAVIIIMVFTAGFFIYKDFSGTKKRAGNSEILSETENAENFENSQEQTEQNSAGISQNKNPAVSVIPKEKIPDLSKPIEIKTALSEETKKETIEKINTLSNSLKKDPDSLEQWMELGLLRKLIGDYEGARDTWEFAALIRPQDYISRHNLGFLYWQNLKDYKKSEENYLKAIELNPKDIGAYIDLSNVYYFSLKNKEKAKEILERGLKSNFKDPELLKALTDLNSQ